MLLFPAIYKKSYVQKFDKKEILRYIGNKIEKPTKTNVMKNSTLSKTVRFLRQAAKHLPYPLFIPFVLSSSLVVGVVHAERLLPELEVESGTLLQFAVHPNLAPVLLHDGFHIA